MVDSDTGARHSWTFHLLSGDAARFGEPFGPETAHLGRAEIAETMRRAFPLRGYERLSRPQGAADFTMIEQAHGWLQALSGEILAAEFSTDVLSVSSTIGPDRDIPPERSMFPRPARGNWFQLCTAQFTRGVDAGTTGGKWHFRSVGPEQDFETPTRYRAKLKRDRLTRVMIFDYMAAFGLDGPAIFGNLAVDDPVLITTDHEGTPLTPLFEEGSTQ